MSVVTKFFRAVDATFGCGACRKESGAESGHLRLGKAAGHGRGAHTLYDLAQSRSRGVHMVGKVVDGIAQTVDLGECEVHAGTPVGHHLSCLGTGKVKGNTHLGCLLSEFLQIVFRDAGLPCRGDDIRDAGGGHGNACGHVLDALPHSVKFRCCVEIHDLTDLGHTFFKVHGGLGTCAESSQECSSSCGNRCHGYSQAPHGISQACGMPLSRVHSRLNPAQGAAHHVHEVQSRENLKGLHHLPPKIRPSA